MSVLNLVAIEAAFLDLQRVFPEINKSLFDRRDPLDDEVVANMLEGYALVDRLLTDRIDIFAMGQLKYWLKLNAVVLCGAHTLDDREIGRAKAQMKVSILAALESPGARAQQLARQMQIHGRPLSLDEMIARVEAISTAEVRKTGAAMLRSQPTLASIGAVAKVPGQAKVAEALRGV